MLTLRKRIAHSVAAALAVFTVGLAGTQLAHADSQALLNDIFEVYTNVTEPQTFETQRRGGLTLGRVVTRNRVVAPNFINFDPPSFSGGCSGIDLYGGSFSFINKDQLTQALRAIASNALSYAFTLALEGVCPTCMQKMEKLRDWVNEINKELKDSCRWGKSLVNASGLDEWHNSRVEKANDARRDAGVVEDMFDAVDTFVSEFASDTDVGATTPENAVWSAMQASNTGAWFGGFGTVEMREVLMSVTGTLIKGETDSGGAECINADTNREYCYREAPPTLTVKDFIDGDLTGPVRIYDCDEEANCLNPGVVERDWPGLKQRVREIMFGPAPAFTGGLIFKIRDKGAVLTPEEEAFISQAPVPIYTILRSVAKYPGTVLSVGEHLQEMVAGQIARSLVLELIGAVRHSFTAEQQQMSAKMSDLIEARVQEFETRTTVEQHELRNMAAFMNLVSLASRQIAQDEENTERMGQYTRARIVQ
jgi:conjugative transfer pilus assembly protein TraH